MKQEELNKVLALHKKWLADEDGGERADLRWADLREADLRWADLREADLREADLREADLREADLRWADLRWADLREADLDFSAWPLWCGSVGVTIDDRLAKQLVYHAMCNLSKTQMAGFLADPVKYANGFHRIGEVKEIQ